MHDVVKLFAITQLHNYTGIMHSCYAELTCSMYDPLHCYTCLHTHCVWQYWSFLEDEWRFRHN